MYGLLDRKISGSLKEIDGNFHISMFGIRIPCRGSLDRYFIISYFHYLLILETYEINAIARERGVLLNLYN